MQMRTACLGVVLAVAGGAPAVAVAAAAPEGTAAADLSGRWRLNAALSTGEPPSGAPALTAPPGKKGDEKKAEAAPAPDKKDDAGSQAPAELTIRQSETTVVVTEKPGATREYYPNGRTYKADEGQSDVRSQWRDGQLVYEKRSQRGWKLSESWQIAPDRSRLTVEVRASGGGQQKVAVKRVYERVAEPAP